MNRAKTSSSLLAIVIAAFFFGTPLAHAYTSCDYYKKKFPALYDIFCQKQSTRSGAGANSAIGSAFNLNPSGLPTQKSPYGLESIGSITRSRPTAFGPDFTLVKGFHKFGTGLSTSSANTFYGNDIMQRAKGTPDITSFKPTETEQGRIANVNLGTAISLIPDKKSKSFDLKLGGAIKYNKTTGIIGEGTGLGLSNSFFNIGFGVSREKISNYLDRVIFLSGILGFKLPFIELEYNILKNAGGYDLQPVHIGTVTLLLGRVLVTGAVRRLNYLQIGDVTQKHFAVQVQISQHFSLGYLYNYIPGTHSAGLQIFL